MEFEDGAQGEPTHGSHRQEMLTLVVDSIEWDIEINSVSGMMKSFSLLFILEISLKELCEYETTQLGELWISFTFVDC